MDGSVENLSSPVGLISEINPIEYGVANLKNRDEIREYVEPPLVSACEHFWDLNIKTLMSSANNKNIGSQAYIDLEYDSLSPENKQIATNFSEVFKMHGTNPINAIKINIANILPGTISTEIEEKSKKIANLFKKQKATWIKSYSIGEMRKNILKADPDDESITSDYFDDYYYDTESQKFFESEELFKKSREYYK